MRDHDRRVSAAQLKNGEETIKKRLRGMKYKIYMRVSANIGVYTSGNEQRMGKGKGKFDYWASRIAVSRIVFELKGDIHEKVAREAFRLAAHKMPGKCWEKHLATLDAYLFIRRLRLTFCGVNRTIRVRQER